MPKANSGYTHNFGVNFWVFKDDEFETEAKTNNGHRVGLLLVGSPPLARTEHSQRPLLTYTEYTQGLLLACCVSARRHLYVTF